jgi:hypothetical protein
MSLQIFGHLYLLHCHRHYHSFHRHSNLSSQLSYHNVNRGGGYSVPASLCDLLFLCALRTDGSLKAALLLLQTAAFIGATLYGIINPHGYAVRLFSVCEVFLINYLFTKISLTTYLVRKKIISNVRIGMITNMNRKII